SESGPTVSVGLYVGHVVGELHGVVRREAGGPQSDRHVVNRPAVLSHDVARLDYLPGRVRPDLAADPHRVAHDRGMRVTTRRRELVGVDVSRPAGRLHEGSMSRQGM